MSTSNAALLVVITTLLVAGCAAAPAATSSPTAAPPPTPTVALTPPPTTTPTTTPAVTPPPATPTTAPATAVASVCEAVVSDAFVRVSGRANIFGAGHDTAPEPGQGGAGVLPPEVEVDINGGAQVTFPCTSGIVDCCAGGSFSDPAGPAGGDGWHTNIQSFGGISGIIHEERGVFLVGVFLGDEEPADPAPERLDFTERCPEACTFSKLKPELGQIFYIGDGGEQSTYVAPAGATRLFLGIADAFFVQGLPGWYGNNSGEFQAAVTVQ